MLSRETIGIKNMLWEDQIYTSVYHITKVDNGLLDTHKSSPLSTLPLCRLTGNSTPFNYYYIFPDIEP